MFEKLKKIAFLVAVVGIGAANSYGTNWNDAAYLSNKLVDQGYSEEHARRLSTDFRSRQVRRICAGSRWVRHPK